MGGSEVPTFDGSVRRLSGPEGRGIVRNIHGKLIDANGRPDHVHCLLSLPPALAVAEALRVIKSNSSLWVHETWHRSAFAWQRGYGALQRQPIQRPGGGEVYSRPGAAPPQDFLSGRIHRPPGSKRKPGLLSKGTNVRFARQTCNHRNVETKALSPFGGRACPATRNG